MYLILKKEVIFINGVYCITNLINNKKYVGFSCNVIQRWRQHMNSMKYGRNKLYLAMKKYGIENFAFNVLEITDNILREQHWIKKLNTIQNGYNTLSGGRDMKYENSPHHILTISEVKDIRSRYSKGEKKRNVYNTYKNKMTYSGFEKVWLNISWVGIMPEVYKVKRR